MSGYYGWVFIIGLTLLQVVVAEDEMRPTRLHYPSRELIEEISKRFIEEENYEKSETENTVDGEHGEDYQEAYEEEAEEKPQRGASVQFFKAEPVYTPVVIKKKPKVEPEKKKQLVTRQTIPRPLLQRPPVVLQYQPRVQAVQQVQAAPQVQYYQPQYYQPQPQPQPQYQPQYQQYYQQPPPVQPAYYSYQNQQSPYGLQPQPQQQQQPIQYAGYNTYYYQG
ncbi:unnamed protein product, partial [Mesorhabditis spiculigera]